MSAYAIANLRTVDFNDEIIDYLERIDATLDAYGGRFVVHGKQPEVVEEPWEGVVIVVEFADVERARAWYGSDAYQAILPLRTRNSDGSAVLVEGVEPGYVAAAFAAQAVAQA